MDILQAAEQPGSVVPGTARRRILAAGLGGAAASLLPFLGGKVGATPRSVPPTDPFAPASSDPSEVTTGGTENTASLPSSVEDTVAPSGSDTAGTEAPTTTLAPVQRPTQEDVAVLGFAQSVELTLRDLYDIVLGGNVFTDEVEKDAIAVIRENHEAYAQAISGLLGRQAPNRRSETLLGEQEDNMAGSAAEVATALATLENVAVATHSSVVATLVGIDGASIIASILEIEARHATVLTKLAGATSFDDLVAGDADPLSADDYPE